ncbi:ABC transporter permease [Oceanobacillus iheyensis HTE831]|uniref:ABC transporter permease n=1 Tax=Oceanobacillus iheyensis (strain DSM 14371 / CIP 107618 / JCM 11309 / KCTC 3954 / HTE831) TaxID=221109 RepID=Q8ES10_OCEIH|nr:ABC transporter permease [Oceanobacillus iheyensis]BAC12790.1 ABC transporter permease [Oceanobacillus iheyensis HTE831]
MTIRRLIFTNLKKSAKNYYLYLFALTFCIALYFSFVTLQYDPAMNEVEGSIKGAAAIRAASVMLIIIVGVFLIYANNLFIKRRSKEIGLLQLVGFTKGKIFQVISIENIIMYIIALITGIFIGFISSRLMMMILIRLMGLNEVAELNYSSQAVIQTLLVFLGIYIVIMIVSALFIHRQRLINLFQLQSSSELKSKKISKWQLFTGILGIVAILFGYYMSSKLFDGDFVTINSLFAVMLVILASVIIGTYLFYKGSVSFIFYLVRKKNNGYLTINKVLSLSSIMFRMRSNSLLLTVITTISALAIGFLSLTYISYYSIEKQAENTNPDHFSIPSFEEAEEFYIALEDNDIAYKTTEMELYEVGADLSNIINGPSDNNVFRPDDTTMIVISDDHVTDVDVKQKESIFINVQGVLEEFMQLDEEGEFTLFTDTQNITLDYIGGKEESIVPFSYTNGGFPLAVVDSSVYEQLIKGFEHEGTSNYEEYAGIDIENQRELEEANDLYHSIYSEGDPDYGSYLQSIQSRKYTMGMIMFIVGFLGLTFLITSGCILYIKQMDESEDEKRNYTILRKIGFTRNDLQGGIRIKQLFNFGIPLVVGICHSYFAVRSGWFFFGTELWTPMIVVILIYTLLYSLFGILSISYYKKVIKASL